THRGEGQVRVRREAAELGLELLERGHEHRLADGAALGDTDGTDPGGGRRGDAANSRLLFDDDNLGREKLSSHGLPRSLSWSGPAALEGGTLGLADARLGRDALDTQLAGGHGPDDVAQLEHGLGEPRAATAGGERQRLRHPPPRTPV